jgi:hypothetical protein
MKLSTRLFSTLIGTLATFAGLITSAHAENFTLSGGVSLNTNNAFAAVDGSPRLSLWAQNNNDNDQIFDRISGNKGGTLLKNRTTGKCINAHYAYNNGKVNVWSCDSNDIEQNFDILDFGNNVTVLRRTGTNVCINSPQHYNGGQVFMWACNGNDPDQRFVRSNTAISANPPGSTPIPTVQQVVSNTTPLYEYWIVSRKTNTWGGIWSPLNYQEVGHSFNALIKKDQENVKVYTGGALTQNYNRDKGGWYIFHTYGFWNVGAGFVTPGDLKIDNGCSNGASSTECQDVKDLLNGKSISQAGSAVRKARVGENRALWIDQNRGIAGCSNYSIAGGGGSNCNCVDYATRSWYVFTANWEDFRPYGTDAKTPSGLVNDLNGKNSDGGFLDGGKTWQ